jgi:hypothetical protein
MIGDRLEAQLPDGVSFCLLLFAGPDVDPAATACAVVAGVDDEMRLRNVLAKTLLKLERGEVEVPRG